MPRKHQSPAERQEKLDAAHQKLIDAVSALTTSDDWCRYLAVMGRFHAYSASNCLMIALQRPDATRVAGFHAWKGLGRRVSKGAKGIAIWAPITRRADPEEPSPDDPTIRRLVGFRLAYVFDVADTEGDSLPETPAPARLLTGEAPAGLWDELSCQVAVAGYRIELVDEIPEAPGANGLTDAAEKVVQIAVADRSPAAIVKTLAHELAHVLLHAETLSTAAFDRSRAEVEAESVAFLVCSAHGLDSTGYTLGYVANWSDGNVDRVLATANAVQRCARRILETAAPKEARFESPDSPTVPNPVSERRPLATTGSG